MNGIFKWFLMSYSIGVMVYGSIESQKSYMWGCTATLFCFYLADLVINGREQ